MIRIFVLKLKQAYMKTSSDSAVVSYQYMEIMQEFPTQFQKKHKQIQLFCWGWGLLLSSGSHMMAPKCFPNSNLNHVTHTDQEEFPHKGKRHFPWNTAISQHVTYL